MATKDFILASSSPQRRALLTQIGYEPKQIRPVNIDESEHSDELPLPYIRRIARAKALAAAAENAGENVLCADTIIVAGQKIIRKSPDAEAQRKVL